MILEKITFPVSNLSDVQYKFCVPEEYKKQEQKYEKRKEPSVDKSIYMVDEVKYAYKNPFCKHYFSRDALKYSINSKMLIENERKQNDILVQRYRCNSCGRLTQTEFSEEYESYYNFTKETKEKSVKNMELNRISLQNTSKTQKNFNNIDISHKTVKKPCLILNNTHFTCDISE
jgi:transposase-like protein